MSNLPRFKPILKDELRTLWGKHREPDIRRLLMEIECSRQVLADVHDHFEANLKKYRKKVGGSPSRFIG
jgi:hypothetical protein